MPLLVGIDIFNRGGSGGGGTATGTGSTVGALLATSTTLPTAAHTGDFTSTEFTFTPSPDLSNYTRFAVSGAEFHIRRFDNFGVAHTPGYPDNVDGFWIILKAAGAETDRFKLHRDQLLDATSLYFEAAYSSNAVQHDSVSLVVDEGNDPADAGGVVERIRFRGDGHSLPSDPTIEIYFSLAGGSVGPRGPRGLQGAAGTDGTNGTDGADGTNGTDGADGTGFDYIWRRSSANTVPSTPASGGTTSDTYLPSGWSRTPASLDSTYRWIWRSDRTGTSGAWSDFGVPHLVGYHGVDGQGGGGTQRTFPEIAQGLNELTGNDRVGYSALRGIPGEVSNTDATEGSSTEYQVWSPLRVREAIEAIETYKTPANLETALSGLTGNDRLPYSAIRDTPTIPTLPTEVTQSEAEARTVSDTRLWSPEDVNYAVQAALAAAVTGNTETGITVTYNNDGTLDFVVGSTPPPTTHQRYFFWRSAATTPTATEMASGTGSMTDATIINTAPDDGAFYHLWIWSAEQLTSILVSNNLVPTDNIFNTFTESRLQISSTNGYLYTRQWRARLIGTAANPVTWTVR